MDHDMVELYRRASEWTLQKVAGSASQLEAPTNCPGWNVRMLLNHMLQTQRYFVDSALGQSASPPSSSPPHLLSEDPVRDFTRAQAAIVDTFAQPGVLEKSGPALGIAFSDHLLHGWDLARSTAQDSTMPDGLAEIADELLRGRFTEDQRAGVFAPERTVSPGASAQDRLLAYTGRDPNVRVGIARSSPTVPGASSSNGTG
jgi:uncharacterized protein (TIGR03086 family)